MKVGDHIEFTNNQSGYDRKFLVKIKKYNNFEEYLEKENLKYSLPGLIL